MRLLDSEESDGKLPLDKSMKRSPSLQSHFFQSFIAHLFPLKPANPISLDTEDCILIVFFLFLGVLSRIIRIQYPKNVVFDEKIYGVATNHYLKGTFFNDIHPPLPRLILSGIAKFAGYQCEYSFEDGHKYKSMFYVMLRLIPAFFGGLCVPFTFLLMRCFNTSKLASFTAAFIVAGDLLLIIEARHYTGDSILHFLSITALLSICLFERFESFGFLLFEGVCLGVVASCKYTSGGIVLLAFIRQFPLKNVATRHFVKHSGTAIARCFILFVLILCIHLLFYSIHLTVLPFKGQDLASMNLPKCIEDSLVDASNPDWVKRSEAASIIRRTVSLMWHNQKMNINVGYSSKHASKWWSWPLLLGRWVEIWNDNDRHLVCTGNPLIWVPVFISTVVNLLRVILVQDLSSETTGTLFGYVLSYLPLMLLPRDLYLFHYAIPLLFGIFQLVMMVDHIPNDKIRGFLLYGLVHMAIIGFMIWNPLVYGRKIDDLKFRAWNSNWMS